MRTQLARFSRIFVLFAFVSLLPLRSFAQTDPTPARITQAVDESQLTVLKGNTYYLASAQYDKGPAPAALPMNRMLLVLRRSPAQEAALEQFLGAATGSHLAELSPVAHASAIRPAVWSRRPGHPDRHALAAIARLPGLPHFEWPHGNRIFRDRRTSPGSPAYRNSSIRHSRPNGPENTGPIPAIRKFPRRSLLSSPESGRSTISRARHEPFRRNFSQG